MGPRQGRLRGNIVTTPTDHKAAGAPAAGRGEAKHKRRLPWQVAKSADDDPAAPARLQAILASPTYVQADQDERFLAEPSARGVRLQLDFLKAEQTLEAAGITHTVVVYGSTRIGEPAALRRRLARAEARLAAAPTDPELRSAVAAARRLNDKARYYDMAREFGRLASAASADPRARLVVMTGGGPGIMEAANRGAHDAGAESIGLNITLPHEQCPNPYITPQLCFRFHYFAIRKLHFLLRARALVAFPGGYGTFDELFETLTLIQTRKMPAVPIVLVGRNYWDRVVDLDFMVEEGAIDPEDRRLVSYADSATEAWQIIRDWYATRGNPEFPLPPAGAGTALGVGGTDAHWPDAAAP